MDTVIPTVSIVTGVNRPATSMTSVTVSIVINAVAAVVLAIFQSNLDWVNTSTQPVAYVTGSTQPKIKPVIYSRSKQLDTQIRGNFEAGNKFCKIYTLYIIIHF
jgi:hypothetical protein